MAALLRVDLELAKDHKENSHQYEVCWAFGKILLGKIMEMLGLWSIQSPALSNPGVPPIYHQFHISLDNAIKKTLCSET